MQPWAKRFEWPMIVGFFVVGSVFLFKMAYLPGYISLPVGALLLGLFHHFVQSCYGVRIPLFLLLLLWLSIALDWLGNILGLYNAKDLWIAYDSITHTAVPLLVTPVMVWLMDSGLKRFGYALPLPLVALFAVTTMFTLAGFYEVLELWDDKYMHPDPGWRIHGPYDTPNDLQCDLLGMVLGGLLAYLWMRRDATATQSALHAAY
ncbi:MAG: hypothetical protein HOP19_00435 [Acidobacteria bacterium]|nr:hypothetical protein [Acidobacteriota bacterium]